MQKVAHGRPAASWQDDLHKANLCLMVLKYCASADGTAQRFLEELQELHDYISAQKTTEIDGNHQTDGLSSADISHVFEEQPMFNQNPGNADSELDPTYLIEIPPTAKPEHIERSHQILTKLCEPFGDSQSEGLSIADVKQRWRDEPTRGLHTLMIARLDWDLESRQPFIWDTKKLSSSNIPSDKIGQEPLSHEPVGKKPRRDLDIPAGRFVGSTAPSGWAPFGDVAGSASGVAGSKETRTKSDVGC